MLLVVEMTGKGAGSINVMQRIVDRQVTLCHRDGIHVVKVPRSQLGCIMAIDAYGTRVDMIHVKARVEAVILGLTGNVA